MLPMVMLIAGVLECWIFNGKIMTGKKLAVEVFMPKMSDHMESAEIIRWLVREGDYVEKGQAIIEIQTDKVTAELEAPASGVLKGTRSGAKDGATIPVGETIAFIAKADEDVPVLPPLGAPISKEMRPDATLAALSPKLTPVKGAPGQVRATSAARRMADELRIDLDQLTGSGPGGRVTKEDVHTFAKGVVRTSPAVRRLAKELNIDLTQVKATGPGGRIKEEDVRAFAKATKFIKEVPLTMQPAQTDEADVKWQDLSQIQRITGQRMLESLTQTPQFSLSVDVDMTEVLKLRKASMDRILKKTGERLSITAILIKVVASALREHPRANASFDNGRIKLHQHINVGVAVGTDKGLIVPVIKKADQKSLEQITGELKTFSIKAQKMHFSSEDLFGGTFTISNLGMYEIDRFNAIINPPESAILAVGQVNKIPVGMPDESIALRPMMSLTLSVDHRCMDGIQGAKFLAEIKALIRHLVL